MAKHKEILAENSQEIAKTENEHLDDAQFKYFVEKLGMTEAQALALPEIARTTMMTDIKAKPDKSKPTKELYSYESGMKWNQQLNPRQSSGFKNQITINVQMTDGEVFYLQEKARNDNVAIPTNKSDLEKYVLSLCGYTRA
jgi:hypothetical protein